MSALWSRLLRNWRRFTKIMKNGALENLDGGRSTFAVQATPSQSVDDFRE